jgi:hypothetical protein
VDVGIYVDVPPPVSLVLVLSSAQPRPQAAGQAGAFNRVVDRRTLCAIYARQQAPNARLLRTQETKEKQAKKKEPPRQKQNRERGWLWAGVYVTDNRYEVVYIRHHISRYYGVTYLIITRIAQVWLVGVVRGRVK